MKKLPVILLFTFHFSFFTYLCNAQIITTVAGNGHFGFYGDGGPATAAELNDPFGVSLDAAGNIYIPDAANSCVRKVNTSGTISTIAGDESQGFSGDGTAATSAQLSNPAGVAVDNSGNIYIADEYNQRIRMVNTSGIISTFAGNGANSYSGDGGAATSAEINYPYGLAADASNNIYIADANNNRIRVVNTSGIINTYAGNGANGFYGDGGQATAAELFSPAGVAMDASGNLFIADVNNQRIRMVNTSGVINTVAGNGVGGYSGDGGPATSAEINVAHAVCTDILGNFYIAEFSNSRVRSITASGIINTVAGDGANGYFGDGGQATSAELSYPYGVAADTKNNLYICDYGNQRIRMVAGLTTGINEPIVKGAMVNLYPNPNTGQFTITGIEKGMLIELYDYTGRQISNITASDETMQFNLTNHANGIYLMRIISKNGNVVSQKKVVKTQ